MFARRLILIRLDFFKKLLRLVRSSICMLVPPSVLRRPVSPSVPLTPINYRNKKGSTNQSSMNVTPSLLHEKTRPTKELSDERNGLSRASMQEILAMLWKMVRSGIKCESVVQYDAQQVTCERFSVCLSACLCLCESCCILTMANKKPNN